ncbi:MAG: hypothetical protein ABIS30_00660 [Gallionella sp.]
MLELFAALERVGVKAVVEIGKSDNHLSLNSFASLKALMNMP